jgi:hypothetical protein
MPMATTPSFYPSLVRMPRASFLPFPCPDFLARRPPVISHSGWATVAPAELGEDAAETVGDGERVAVKPRHQGGGAGPRSTTIMHSPRMRSPETFSSEMPSPDDRVQRQEADGIGWAEGGCRYRRSL